MSGDLFLLLALGALLVFILFESWRGRPSALKGRIAAANGFLPGGAAQETACFGLAAAFLVCSVLAFGDPELPHSGRRLLLITLLQSWFGALTACLLFLIGALVALVAGVLARRKRLAATAGTRAK